MKVSKKIVPVLVDCNWGRKNQSISSKYGVRGYPTVLFTDPRGEVVSKLRDRSPNGVKKQMLEIANRYRGRDAVPTKPADLPWTKSYDEALYTAKKEDRPFLVLLTDETKGAMSTEHALADKKLEGLVDQFVLHRLVVSKNCPMCKKHRVTRGINIHVLDASASDPYARPFDRISGKRSAKALESSLKRTLERWKKSRSLID